MIIDINKLFNFHIRKKAPRGDKEGKRRAGNGSDPMWKKDNSRAHNNGGPNNRPKPETCVACYYYYLLFYKLSLRWKSISQWRENAESTVSKAPQAPKTAMSASSNRLGAPN